MNVSLNLFRSEKFSDIRLIFNKAVKYIYIYSVLAITDERNNLKWEDIE